MRTLPRLRPDQGWISIKYKCAIYLEDIPVAQSGRMGLQAKPVSGALVPVHEPRDGS